VWLPSNITSKQQQRIRIESHAQRRMQAIILLVNLTKLLLLICAQDAYTTTATAVSIVVTAPRSGDWDSKYYVCCTNNKDGVDNISSSDSAQDCYYDYCDINASELTICDYNNFTDYFTTYGKRGQDCRSFSMLEDYIETGYLPSQARINSLCNRPTHYLDDVAKQARPWG
jgi:hypothetical protein